MSPTHRFFILMLFVLVCLSGLQGGASSAEETESDSGKTGIFEFYGKYISPIDGDRCRMHPSCSEYFKRSIKKHGMVTGWIMGCDRLLRCGGDEAEVSRSIRIKQKNHLYDPVENNDFWWHEDD